MLSFVLVHGGFADGECWAGTAKALNDEGHETFAPTLPGHGIDADRDVSHDDQVQAVVQGIRDRGLRDVTLVGHSYGGCVIQKVAEEIPERITRLVFHCAIVVRNGFTALNEIQPDFSDGLDFDSLEMPLLPLAAWRDRFMNDSDLSLAESTYKLLSPNPIRPLMKPLDTSRFFELELPISVLITNEDNSMRPGWEFHPLHTSRLPMFRLLRMPGGHAVVFSNPEGLAAKLVEAGRP